MRSSRVLEQECTRIIEMMCLLQQLKPDHNTIANFRGDHHKAIRKVFSPNKRVKNKSKIAYPENKPHLKALKNISTYF